MSVLYTVIIYIYHIYLSINVNDKLITYYNDYYLYYITTLILYISGLLLYRLNDSFALGYLIIFLSFTLYGIMFFDSIQDLTDNEYDLTKINIVNLLIIIEGTVYFNFCTNFLIKHYQLISSELTTKEEDSLIKYKLDLEKKGISIENNEYIQKLYHKGSFIDNITKVVAFIYRRSTNLEYTEPKIRKVLNKLK